MNKELIALLHKDATIITLTDRLSRYIHHQYTIAQQQHNKTWWETPNCLTWPAWCNRIFESLKCLDEPKPMVLNTLQQQWLWQDIINNSKYRKQLLEVSVTAQNAQHAYFICRQWGLPIFPKAVYLSNEARAFKAWVDDYEQYKKAHNYIDQSSLPDYLLANISRYKTTFKEIIFYGFEQLTTQQQQLINALKNLGIKITSVNIPNQQQTIAIYAQDDPTTELMAAACWAKEQINIKQAASIGIVAPNLRTIRNEAERVFQSVFEPLPLKKSTPLPQYSIALGKPLLSYPLIKTAMNLLSLSQKKISLTTLSSLLHSPFIKDGIKEQNQRANFDAALRAIGQPYIKIKSLFSVYQRRRHHPHLQCDSFFNSLKSSEKLLSSYAQSWQQWCTDFSKWLILFGWPGERVLNSEEQQTLEKFQTTLEQLAQLDIFDKPIFLTDAVKQLKQVVAEENFQPETPETKIQVIGIEGAAAMQFDALWILNMGEHHWPPLKPMDPFIPKELQRKLLPAATVEAQLVLANQRTEQLIQSSKNVVFSYVNQEDGENCQLSVLIKNHPKVKQHVSSITAYPFKNELGLKEIIYQSKPELDKIDDFEAPTIPINTPVKGGTSIFKDQKACPFKAFAHHRLQAYSLRELEIGLSPLERGNLAHYALEQLWQKLKTKKDLISKKNHGGLEEIIKAAVKTAIINQKKQQPDVFTRRFTELEQHRLQKLLNEWLDLELERDDFEVVATEQKQQCHFADIELNTRIDRMDKLTTNGQYVIVDYKTGRVTPKDWTTEDPTEPPNEPQLPLYAITSERKIDDIAFARLRLGELGFVFHPAAKNKITWEEQRQSWRQSLHQLAKDFRNGKAAVEPDKKACEYCDLHALCRINECVDDPNNK